MVPKPGDRLPEGPASIDSGPPDDVLVQRARAGDRAALEALLRRYQGWIYNFALRMVWLPEDAKDVTQEVLVKIVTHLSGFRGESTFRTWLYRVTANHVRSMQRSTLEKKGRSFESYAARINACDDLEIEDPAALQVGAPVLYEESRLACTLGMLLCLDREQRLALVLGAIMNTGDEVGAEVLGVSRSAFRQRLSRARADLKMFMQGQCGLVNEANPCRCSKKTRAFIDAGVVNPGNLRFYDAHVSQLRDELDHRSKRIERWLGQFIDQPFARPPDLSAAITRALDQPDWREATET